MCGARGLLTLYTYNLLIVILYSCVYIYIYIYIYICQNNVVGIEIKLWDRQKKKGGLIVGKGSRSFSFPKGPNRFGSQSSLLLNGH
jgi:hypothetical protein